MKERYTDFSVTDRDLQSMSLPSKEMQPGKFIAVQTRLLNMSSVAVQLLVMKMCRSSTKHNIKFATMTLNK